MRQDREKVVLFHVSLIVRELQELEGLNGPETLEEYIDILTKVKEDVEKRLYYAKERQETEKKRAKAIASITKQAGK